METYTTTIANLGTEIIPLGRAGETGYRAVAIDCSSWLATLPDGALELIFENPNGDTYLAQDTSISDGVLTWRLTDVDTQYNGIGAIQLNLMDEDVIAKSVIAKVNILPSLGIGGDVPTPAEDWLDHMIEAQREAEYYAGQAEAFSDQAIAAEGRATLAAGTAIEAKDDAVLAKADAEYAAEQAERALTHAPKIQSGTWWVWDAENEVYVDTHVQAQGPQGEQGIQGIPGNDGFSPTANVTQAGNVTTITITDKDGTTTESIDLSEYAKVDGTYPNLLAGDLISDGKITDNKPYVSRVTDNGNEIVGKRSYPTIVGATIAWNQIAPSTADGWNVSRMSVAISGSKISLTPTSSTSARKFATSPVTLIKDHIYFVHADYPGDEGNIGCDVGFYTNVGTNSYTDRVVLTAGTPATIRSFWKPTADNELFAISTATSSTPSNTAVINNVICSDVTTIFGSAEIANYVYALEQNEAGSGLAWLRSYDFFAKSAYAFSAGNLQSVCVSAHKTYDANNNLLGNYALDGTKEFRGLFKIDANNDLYADGDVYEADGTVTRKYGVVDLGQKSWTMPDAENHIFRITSLSNHKITTGINAICSKYPTCAASISANANMPDKSCKGNTSSGLYFYVRDTAYSDAATFKTSMSGVYLVYELETPTTESADPYTAEQAVEAGGTEEYVDALVVAGTRDVAIPVGHETEYLIGLRNLLETQLPPAPSADGTYTLKCTITGGVKTFSWEA